MSPDLEAIKARLAAAAPGPWTSDGHYIATGKPAPLVSGPCAGVDGVVRLADCETTWRAREEKFANADLIAHAPTDLAALIREVEQLRAAIRETYTAPDPAAFFAAERALRSLVSDTLDEQATQQAFEALPPKVSER